MVVYSYYGAALVEMIIIVLGKSKGLERGGVRKERDN